MTVANRVGHSIHPAIGHAYVRLVSGQGVFVTDDTGKTYLDAVAGIGVMALGYGRDDLVEAYAEQARGSRQTPMGSRYSPKTARRTPHISPSVA